MRTATTIPTASEPHLLGPVAKALLRQRRRTLIADLRRLDALGVPGVRMHVDAAVAAIDDGIAEVSK